MSSNTSNQVPFLRTQRLFPQEAQALSVEVDRMYVDVANNMNRRILGINTINNPVQTGEILYLNGQQFSGFRQVFTFTGTSSITHNIQIVDKTQFVNCYGDYTDSTNSYGLLFGTSVAVAGLVSFYISATQIVFVIGAGAPALTSGRLVLSWFNG